MAVPVTYSRSLLRFSIIRLRSELESSISQNLVQVSFMRRKITTSNYRRRLITSLSRGWRFPIEIRTFQCCLPRRLFTFLQSIKESRAPVYARNSAEAERARPSGRSERNAIGMSWSVRRSTGLDLSFRPSHWRRRGLRRCSRPWRMAK